MEVSEEKLKKFIPGRWGCRHTIAFMGLVGYMLAYSMRFNMSLAIVDLVDHGKSLGNTNSLNKSGERHDQICQSEDAELMTSFANTTDNKNDANQLASNGSNHKFHWTEEDQGLIIGSFFWGYVLTQYPGGKLSHYYGAKWVISISLLVCAVLSMALPYVTIQWGRNGLIALRMAMGIAQGGIFPASNALIAQWTPLEERSRFTTITFVGIPLGSAVTLISGGYIIHNFGWPMLFYAVAVCTFVWFILWTFLVYSFPHSHPRITAWEMEILEEIRKETGPAYIPTPWKSVIRSPPVLAIVIIHIGHTWGHYLLHSEAPKYLHTVHKFEIRHNGLYSATPQLLHCLVSIIISSLSDFLIVKDITSVSFTRKMCSTLATWGSAAGFIGMIFSECFTTLAVVFMNVAGAAMGGGFGGWIVNTIDIAPNHAGAIMGVTNAISNCLGFLAPYISGLILQANPSLTGWKIVFLIPAVCNIIANIIYITFAKTDEMEWNRPRQSEQEEGQTSNKSTT